MTDLEIARSTQMFNIKDVASKLNLTEDNLDMYGKYKAKINVNSIYDINNMQNGKLVLVTAINPTPYGEGKTTVTIGLGDALNSIGKKTVIALREPSLGPVFGTKGGATGGGHSQVMPMDDINLHFTGDIHAIESANNLLCAAIDNHIFQGNELNIDINKILVKRSIDLNDRTLREITIGIGDKNGVERKDGFNITVASEVMAILCLSKDIYDLKYRLGEMIVAYDNNESPVYAKQLGVDGAMTALLKDAIKPNLVQTLEHNPVIIHGGPFANIAHGCSSIIGTNLALKLGDYVVTEAGFGSDLGAEKFFDIKCRLDNLKPSATVLVATIRALKYNGNDNLEKGLCNLEKHIENIKKFNVPLVVALNKFDSDTNEEIEMIKNVCMKYDVAFEICDCFAKGSEGAKSLAYKVSSICENTQSELNFIYDVNDSIKNKIEKVTKEIYGAGNIIYSEKAEKEINNLERLGLDKKLICIAKTQMSLSDDKNELGRPEGFDFNITDIIISNGANFIVCYAGNILVMPGLSKEAAYHNINIDNEGNIQGIF